MPESAPYGRIEASTVPPLFPFESYLHVAICFIRAVCRSVSRCCSSGGRGSDADAETRVRPALRVLHARSPRPRCMATTCAGLLTCPERCDQCVCVWRCAALHAAPGDVRAPPLRNTSRRSRVRTPGAPCDKPSPSPRSPLRREAKPGRSWRSAWGCRPVAIRGSRRIRGSEFPTRKTPRVLGLDDCAWKKADRYGTLLVDLEARCPVDLLASSGSRFRGPLVT